MDNYDMKSSSSRGFWRRILSFILMIVFFTSSISHSVVFAVENLWTEKVHICSEDWTESKTIPITAFNNAFSKKWWTICDGNTWTWTTTEENKSKNTLNSDEDCLIYDSQWAPRQIWNKKMLSTNLQDKESVKTLYKVCTDWNNGELTYSPTNMHPWCSPVTRVYNQHLSQLQKKNWNKKSLPKWHLKKYKNCISTGYPMKIKDIENQEKSILLNGGEDTVESLSVQIELTPTSTPDYISFSEDSISWSDWESFAYTKDFLLSSLSWKTESGLKTVYVRYMKWWEISQAEYDQITLVNKYDYELTLTNNWLKKKEQYEAWKTYKMEFSAKNLWSLKWTSNTMLSYKLLDSNNQVINTATNLWILGKNEVSYNESTTIKIPVRLENNISWDVTIAFDMLENWVWNFSDFWSKPLSKTIQVINSQQEERKSLYNTESLSFWIGDYKAITEEEEPSIITVCNELWTNLYSTNEDMSVFQTKYKAGFWRSIHSPYIYSNYINTLDNTVFHSLKYTEYIQDEERLYIYRDASQINSEYCDSEMAEYSNLRECEQHYDDASNLSDNQCLDLTKATALRWVEWNGDNFLPNNHISKAEAVKILLWASNTAVMPYEVWSINDLTGQEWYADYIYSAYRLWIINLDENNNANALEPLAYSESIQAIFEVFNFDVNSCDYKVIREGNQYISAWLYFWVIQESDIPSFPNTENVTRMSMVSSMLNAYYQQTSIANSSNSCPNSIDDRLTRNIQEICSSEKQAVLSSSNTLNEDWISLDNSTKAEILETSWNISKIHVEWLSVTEWTWYIPTTQLAENCTIPTPTDELKEPTGEEVVVASLVGIYAHTEPSATSWYFDFNKDWNGNNQDIIPYNTVLTVLETKWNWFNVQFEDGRTAWIFNWFVAIWPDVILDTPEIKVTWTISWAYNMTVDLRANTNTETKENILWETYEWTKVQVLWKDETNNLYYIKIEDTPKDITEEIFNTHYARLYPNFTLEEVKTMERGITGWIHEDLIKLDWVDYSDKKILNYPFDYKKLVWYNRTVNLLVNQIFFEEFNWNTHKWLDFHLFTWEEVRAVENWVIESIGKETVIIKHDDWKTSLYTHIVPTITKWKTVTPETVIWLVAPSNEEHKSHLHFELKDNNWKNVNPSKYFKIYVAKDSNMCVRKLIINWGVYDWNEIKEKCYVWIWDDTWDMIWCAWFSDVDKGGPYCWAITTAKEKGWVNGCNSWFKEEKVWVDNCDGYVSPMCIYEDTIKIEVNEFCPISGIRRIEALKIILRSTWFNSETSNPTCRVSETLWNNLSWCEVDFLDASTPWHIVYLHEALRRWIVTPKPYYNPDENISYSEFYKMSFRWHDIDKCLLQAKNEEEKETWAKIYQRISSGFTNIPTLKDSQFNIDIPRDYATYVLVTIYNEVNKANSWLINANCEMEEVSCWNFTLTPIKEWSNRYYKLQNSNWETYSDVKFWQSNSSADVLEFDSGLKFTSNQDSTCKINQTNFCNGLADSEYKLEYGFPCLAEKTVNFWEIDHNYTVYTKWLKLRSEKIWFNYFVDIASIQQSLQEKASTDKEVKFSTLLWTYILPISYIDAYWTTRYSTFYYQPNVLDEANKSYSTHIRVVNWRILDKLDSNSHNTENIEDTEDKTNEYCKIIDDVNCADDRIVKVLWYPISSKLTAWDFRDIGYFNGVSWRYQKFVNGEVYEKDQKLDTNTYFVPEPIAKSYREETNWSFWPHWYPETDPIYDSEKWVLTQYFDNGHIVVIPEMIDGEIKHIIYHKFDYWGTQEELDTNAVYREWFQDQMTLEWYNVLIWVWAVWVWIWLANVWFFKKLIKRLSELAKEKSKKIWVARIPIIGRWAVLWLFAYDVFELTAENKELYDACMNWSGVEWDEYIPQYYCWRSSALMFMTGLWIAWGYVLWKTGNVVSRFAKLSREARDQKKIIQRVLSKLDTKDFDTFYKAIDVLDKSESLETKHLDGIYKNFKVLDDAWKETFLEDLKTFVYNPKITNSASNSTILWANTIANLWEEMQVLANQFTRLWKIDKATNPELIWNGTLSDFTLNMHHIWGDKFGNFQFSKLAPDVRAKLIKKRDYIIEFIETNKIDTNDFKNWFLLPGWYHGTNNTDYIKDVVNELYKNMELFWDKDGYEQWLKIIREKITTWDIKINEAQREDFKQYAEMFYEVYKKMWL